MIIKNLCLLGHSSTGKTSIIETIAYLNKLSSTFGTPSLLDTDEEEKRRKTTTNLKVFPIKTKNYKLNLIDTPGFSDFIGEILGGIFAVENIAIVVNAQNPAEVGTERSWFLATEKTNSPIIFIINHFDKENLNFENIISTLNENYSNRIIPLIIPIYENNTFKGAVDVISKKAYLFDKGELKEIENPIEKQTNTYLEKITETIAETSEDLLNKYLDQGELSIQEILDNLKKAYKMKLIFPLFTISSKIPESVKLLLKYIELISLNSDETELLTVNDKDLSALIFKTLSDPYKGRVSYIRVFSGKITKDSFVQNVTKNYKEKISVLVEISGDQHNPINECVAGDICATYKLEQSLSGDVLSSSENSPLKPIIYPEPLYEKSVEPKSKADEEKLSSAINRILEEDPTFKAYRDHDVKQFVISTIGDVHQDYIISKLKNKYKVNIEITPRKIPYLETIKGKAQAVGKYVKQSGGRGQFGIAHLELEPLPRGQGFEFVDRIVGGVIPKNFIPSVEKGIRNAMEEGILSGNKVVDIRAILFDGKYHEVDSSDLAFQIAGAMAFREAMSKSNPILLEPIMNLEILVPDSMLGDVIGLLNTKRARIMGMEASSRKGWQFIKAEAPWMEIKDLSVELKSATQGRATFSMKLSHYEEAPPNISQQVIAESKKNQEEKV
ncbi:MAG: elongation factor G [Candidatus Calescibacterium sp.]|nr:elongation factor G [Candidatus Calescibacterium sp.]MDW8133188.1 elongation factor G [Candidatus Calescibacterium sp.]